MEREHAVITQMWDYCKQCEDIVIVSRIFLDNFYRQNFAVYPRSDFSRVIKRPRAERKSLFIAGQEATGGVE